MARAKCSLTSTHGGQSSRTWHKSAIQFQALSTSICLVTTICFAISSSRWGAVGTTELFSGKCSNAVNINRALQAVVALLAIGISVSFDFFSRLASSPTVDDLREAHSQGRSLDIAVHSFRNVRHISHWRKFGWFTLILLAVPIQLISHSIAFVSFTPSDELNNAVVTTGQNVTYPGVALLRSLPTKRIRSQSHKILPIVESASTEWDKREVSDCRSTYSQDIEGLESHRTLLVITGPGSGVDSKGWKAAQVWNDTTSAAHDGDDSEQENPLWSFAVHCEVNREGFHSNHNNSRYANCRLSYDDSDDSYSYSADAWGDSTARDTSSISWISSPVDGSDMMDAFQTQRVKYCVSFHPPCKVFVSNFFLMVTMLCIILGCTCSAFVARLCWHKETCQSLGDALQVFLKGGETFVQMPGALPAGPNPEGTAPPSTRWTPVSKWEEVRPRWGQAISKSMWLGTYVPIAALLLGGSAALGALSGSISQSFGESLKNRFIHITDFPFSPSNDLLKLAVYCLTVNAPQLSISICYFAFSSLYSALFQAKYWADFSTNAQLLRVSYPSGEQQESTPALQFPWVWGLSFILLKAAIGWSLTQSFYLVPISEISMWDPNIEFHYVEMYIGFSMRAMILTVAVAAVAASIPLLLSIRHLPPASVVVGTDSGAIAAYCPTNTIGVRYQGLDEGQQAAMTAWDDVRRSRRHLQPLRWGVLNLGSATLGRPGVLGLGTEDEVLGQPLEGQEYVSVAGHFKLYVPSQLEGAEATM